MRRRCDFPLAANGGFTLPFNPVGWFKTTTANKDLHILMSAAQDVDGLLVYVEVD